jgi:G3E family GTPase
MASSSDNNTDHGSSSTNTYDNYDYDSDDDDDEAPDLILVTPDYSNDGDNNTTATSAATTKVEAKAEANNTTTNSNSISSSPVVDTADTDASITSTSINPTVTPTSPSNNNNEQDNNSNECKEKQEQEQQKQKPCPVTILTGFLGSGKTTLINYILKSPDHGKRIAVIENEFGGGSSSSSSRNNEDKGLLSVESLIARDGLNDEDSNGNNNNTLQDLIELPNGCICCTVKDTLIVTLELLIAKKRTYEIDYIIIEASGVADPGPIASIFWLDETLESRLKLDGIICMIDCKHIVHQISDTEEASKQIAYSDRIILNKIDLLDVDDEEGESIQNIETEIRKIHPIVPIVHTSYSKIPNLNWILDADCFGGSSRIEEVELSLNYGNSLFCTDVNVNNNQNPPPLLPYNIPLQNSYKHKHTSSISTVAFELNGSISIKKLNSWLADILWPNQDESDKVLTAMLYKDEKQHDDSKRPRQPQLHDDNVNDNDDDKTTAAAKTATAKTVKTTQQIFRIKGIVSVVHLNGDEDEEDNDDDDVVVESGDDNNNNDTKRLDDFDLDPRRYIVQGVYDLWDIHPASGKDLNFQPDEKRIGKIIIIGKHLDEQKLKEGFQECFSYS